jgi:signal transduction histidine kinase/CheY-like chemotaxis protein
LNTSSNDAENASSPQSLPIRLWQWTQDVKHDDLNVVRRGKQFSKLCVGLFVQVTLIFILQLFIPTEGTGIALYLVLIALALLYVFSIVLTRAGKVSLAGVLCSVAVLFLLGGSVLTDNMPRRAEWFYVISIFMGGVAVRPALVLLLYAVASMTMVAGPIFFDLPLDEDFRSKMILLFVLTLVVYLQGKWTDAAFQKAEEARKQAADAEAQMGIALEQAKKLKQEAIEARDVAIKAKQEALIAKEEAEQANATKSQFLATMSHELRTPLNAIIGYADIIYEDLEYEELENLDRDTILNDAGRIRQSGRLLLELINDVLDLSKVEAGKIELFRESIELDHMCDALDGTMQSLIKPTGNVFEIINESNHTRLYTDRTRLRQILLNLLSNAAKFTHQGTITLRINDRPGDLICFEVEDEGIGMSHEQLERIFEAFVQADSTTTREYGGTGLGLALSKNFATLLGGTLEAESKRGEGSVFRLTIPVGVLEETQDDAQSSGSSHILLVDDDQVLLEYFERAMQRTGYRVTTASDGQQALDLLRQDDLDIDAVLLDLKMPGLSGWEVLAEIKSDASLAEIPVIIISGDDEHMRAMSLGVSDYLIKPIERDALLRALRQSLLDSARGKENAKVLVVDDEHDNRALIQRLLKNQNFILDFAMDGLEAIDVLEESERLPDVVLLDLMMPKMDGFEVIERLQQHEEWSKIPVIIVTAKDLDEAERSFLEARAEEVLTRSGLTRQQLLDRMVHVLS